MADAVATNPVRDSVAKVGEVAVGEDLVFQRKWWRFERAVWAFFVLLIGLAVSGAFGRGPLAQARLLSPDGALDLHYERIERVGTPSMMTVVLGPQAVHDGMAELFVSDTIVGGLGAERIIPQPARTVSGRGGLTYAFPVDGPPAAVRLELRPPAAGVHAFDIAVPGQPPLHARIIVMP